MWLDIILLVVGIYLVLAGADKFTDGAGGLARKWKVSELMIGLTIVAMGTSLPEFVISLLSSIEGKGSMSVGNVVGSNIFNTLAIVGASSLCLCIAAPKITLYRDLTMSLVLSIVLFYMALDGTLTRMDGLMLTLLFVAFMCSVILIERKSTRNAEKVEVETKPMWQLILYMIGGIVALVGGGQLLVRSAVNLASAWGVSESVIGLTILAGGTSLPELATSLVATRKGTSDLALGNAIGSNIFNITFVLGLCSLASPMAIPEITQLDWFFLIGSNVVLGIFIFTGMRLVRLEGLLLLLTYIAYIVCRIYGM